MNPSKAQILSILSLFCLLIPLGMFILWTKVFDMADEHIERVAIYNSYLPQFMETRLASSGISILFGILGIVLASISLKTSHRILSAFNLLCIIVGGSVLILNIWSLL